MIDFKVFPAGKNDQILVMELSGKLDNSSAEYFFDCVQGEVEDGEKNVIVDCEKLEFISSLGIGMLMRIQSRLAKQGGTIKLANVSGMIATVIRTVRLDSLLGIYDSVDDAIASFES